MADRVRLVSPLGQGTAMVSARRVDRYTANGWREQPKAAPKRSRKKQTDNDDAEQQD